ncbi:UTRA domain-containing protein [Bifidobacterium aquikefiricola]|uniref:UTRA domain-containing protein n=1 Tax=Bifidobacterium TaxID=1678 RepID=UPI0034E283D2
MYRVRRLRFLDVSPFMLENSRFPQDLFPKLEHQDLTKSIYKVMYKVKRCSST